MVIMQNKIIDDGEIWTTDLRVKRSTLIRLLIADYVLWFGCGVVVGYFIGVLAR